MKKAEAISILATSVRPREAKDRARYDKAVKMAIEALKSSEIPNNSERTAETAQADHVADIGKKAEGDCISRQAAIAEFSCCELTPDGGIDANYAIDFLKQLPPVQPEIIKCKDCKHWEIHKRLDIPWCRCLHSDMGADDYCSYAELRGDSDD